MNDKASALHFTLNQQTIAAQAWGNPTSPPVLCLHGWLDNSESFRVLAPKLDNYYCVAIDHPGHGLSSHRPGLTDYSLLADVADIIAVVNQLSWSQFRLIGHSRGAMIAFLLAGIVGDKVTHSLMLDAFSPPVIPNGSAPLRFKRSVQALMRKARSNGLSYENLDQAVSARCQSAYAISPEAARYIVERNTHWVHGRLHWRTDAKLFAPSLTGLYSQDIEAYAQGIQAKLALVRASAGLDTTRAPDVFAAMESMVDHLQVPVTTVPGGHFCHMEASAADVANITQAFFIT